MLNIKEIAKLAGFSISTVSKVMNGKDAGISDDTKKRILQVIKEYNYTPYSNIHKRDVKSFLIALLLKSISRESAFLSGILCTAKKNGYSLLLNYCDDSLEDEKKALLALARQNPDGVLWESAGKNERSLCDQYLENKIPFIFLGISDSEEKNDTVVGIDMKQLGYLLTQRALGRHHVLTACLVDKKQKNEDWQSFVDGYRACLFERSVPADNQWVIEFDGDFSFQQILLHNISAVICINSDIAGRIYHEAQTYHVSIPRDLSILSLLESTNGWKLAPELSGIVKPDFQAGEAAAQTLINTIEHIEKPVVDYSTPLVIEGASLTEPSCLVQPRILVIGSTNMDIILHCSDDMGPGMTNIAYDCTSLPGGKGANQAIGVAKLGVPVRLFSRIGKDTDGLTIFSKLHKLNIETQYVIIDTVHSTGKAYIYVPDNGESAITVYLGANADFKSEDIDNHPEAFDNVSYCLLQTEISGQMAVRALAVCHERGIKTILKPASLHTCSPELLKNVDFFVPNEQESKLMAPDCASIEERANLFIRMGAKAVIITLGSKGCYYRDAEYAFRFGAAPFEPVDTTGAADAFIAALACCLYRREPVVRAIQFASYAGGISVTKEGSQTGLIDYRNLMKVADSVDELISVENAEVDV